MIHTMKDGTHFNIDRATKYQFDDAMELAYRVFLKYEAQQYGQEGTDKFAEFLTSPQLQKLFNAGHYILYVATLDDKIIGIASLRNCNHLSLLFVDDKYHRQGVASQLVKTLQNYLLEHEPDCETITVNASPYGEPFYLKTGFMAQGERQRQDGIIFRPMEMYL